MIHKISDMKSKNIGENTNIIFAGNNHGGIVAFKSLQKYFLNIEVITDDENIISLLRKTDKIIKFFLDTNTEIVVCAGYHSIINKDILKRKIIINTHPSLLPKYRGMHGLVWGMLNFEDVLGFTIHLMNEYIDDGDIIEQFEVRYNNETSQEIMQKFDKYVLENLGRVVFEFLIGKIIPLKQKKCSATWVTKRNIEDCIVDFNRENIYIERFFKALVRPYPLPMLKINGVLYEIVGHKLIDIKYDMTLGRVVNIENKDVYIKVKDGLLIINKLINFETKNITQASDIVKIGKRL